MSLRRIIAWVFFALCLSALPCFAQTSSTRAALQTQNNSAIAPNGVGAITGSVMNSMLGNIIASEATLLDFNSFLNAPVYNQTGIPFSSAGNPLLFLQCSGLIEANGSSAPTCIGSSAFPLNPGSTVISPKTNGGVLSDNNGVLGDSTTLPSGVSLSGAVGLPLSTGVSGQLPLANGGANASLTASNGGIVYSGASSLAILGGTVTANQCLLSGSNAAPTWGACSGAGVSSFNSRTGAIVPSGGDYSTGQLTTAATGSSPAVGALGETQTNTGGASTVISNNVVTTLASVSLSPGDWNCYGLAEITMNSGTTYTTANLGITSTPSSMPAFPASLANSFVANTVGAATYIFPYYLASVIVRPTTTTSYSLVYQEAFSAGTVRGQGYVQCVRQD